MHDFKKLNVWIKSMDLASKVYEETAPFPKSEMFGLTNQIRRCAVSIPSNIAEGAGRSTAKDFRNFLHYAYGSSCELETQIRIAISLHYQNEINGNELLHLINDVQKMLYGLINSSK